MASIWKLPVIFFCENNGYAVTTSVAKSHGQPDIARRGDGYAVPGVIVDGQDAEAVHEATREAVERARAGGGPTLIEAKTYRFGEHAHSLAIPISYRSEEELNHYKTERDPVTLRSEELGARGMDADAATIEPAAARIMDQDVQCARASPAPTNTAGQQDGNEWGR